MIINILSIAGIVVAVFGILVEIYHICIKRYSLSDCLAYLLLFLFIGIELSLPGIICPTKNVVITLEKPTSVVKNDTFTIIHHVVGGVETCSLITENPEFLNSTNIMIEKVAGKNFYNLEVTPIYNVKIIKENK